MPSIFWIVFVNFCVEFIRSDSLESASTDSSHIHQNSFESVALRARSKLTTMTQYIIQHALMEQYEMTIGIIPRLLRRRKQFTIIWLICFRRRITIRRNIHMYKLKKKKFNCFIYKYVQVSFQPWGEIVASAFINMLFVYPAPNIRITYDQGGRLRVCMVGVGGFWGGNGGDWSGLRFRMRDGPARAARDEWVGGRASGSSRTQNRYECCERWDPPVHEGIHYLRPMRVSVLCRPGASSPDPLISPIQFRQSNGKVLRYSMLMI